MKVLITGGAGFIGKALVKALSKHYEVVVYDKVESDNYKDQSNFIAGDILDKDKLLKSAQGCEFIFHFAGLLGTHELIDDVFNSVKVNILGTINVLDVAKDTNAKLLFASKPNVWRNTYSITKSTCEEFIQMYRENFHLEAVIVKFFNVYGPGQLLFHEINYRKYIPHVILDALKNEPINIYGNGEQTVDLVHTTDTVNACLAIVRNWEKSEGKTFEVGKDEIVLNDLTELIIQLTNSKSIVKKLPMRKGEIPETKLKANTRLLKEVTGFQPSIDLKEGLMETIDWYKGNYLKSHK
ncbi:MAG: NAD-dependent epimerase/dehydratase family protein [Leptospiraceae bacterium]|nr:NAD-dependent epimerase/dehydratase family protein [Leptospiraceae bacterium]